MTLVIDIKNQKKLNQVKAILTALEIDFSENNTEEDKIKYTEAEFRNMLAESRAQYEAGEYGTLTDEKINELFGE